MKKGFRNISQLEVLKFFWDNSKFYNRCYITMISNCALYLRFDSDIELERIIGRFNEFCKDCRLKNDNVTIQHREFVEGRFTTNKDYEIWFNIFTTDLI